MYIFFLFIFFEPLFGNYLNLLVNACFNNPCQNGATCQSNGNTYICICAAFYSGTNCQTCKIELKFKIMNKQFNFLYLVSNACSNNPCLNGATCQVTGSGSTYTCACPPSYSGLNCQICKIKHYYNGNKGIKL